MDSQEQQSFPRRLFTASLGTLASSILAALLVAIPVAFSGGPLLLVIGLLFPIALLFGVVLGPWIALVHPQSRLGSFFEFLAPKERRTRLVLGGLLLVLACVIIGEMSLRLLGAFASRPAAGGALLTASAVGMLLLMSRLVEFVGDRWARSGPVPSAGRAILLSFCLPPVLLAALIFSGTTSGVGRVGALFGVLRRPELDLTPVVQLVATIGVIYAGGMFARRQRSSSLIGAAVVSLVLGGAATRSARSMDFRIGVELERTRDLAALSLSALRWATDRDHDGFSFAFGGGDCDDANAEVHPGAVDARGNRIDEDCNGGDRPVVDRVDAGVGAPVEVAAAKLPQRANFLLLTIDTLRADLGYARKDAPKKLSPHLDAFAARSTVYEHAYSLASYTSKSLPPMFIGRYPSETKRTFEHFDRFSPDVPWVQERLQKAGVATTSVQGYWYFFFKGYGFERGWDNLDSTAAPQVVAIEGDKTSNGDKLADRTIEHLGRLKAADKPFFVWTHWVDPHSEYVPHDGFDLGSESRQRYDGEVAFVDAQVGRVLAALEANALHENTVVLVTSDHGEAFGEKGMIRHGFEVWEPLMHVPLIVHVPGVAPRKVSERRSTIDVAPTILETFEIEVPRDGAHALRGVSLYRDALASPAAKLDERPVLVDMPEGPHTKERRAFYSGDYKLITNQGRPIGLYDLSKDPGEERDLSSDTALLEKIQALMNQFLDALEPLSATK